jgi:glycosyltransferase involved in cell wall biosynthesis
MDLYKNIDEETRILPLISIIIPVYNTDEYIKKCLMSVIRQTYKNLEIIIINDGSEDNSLSICEDIAEEDPRISIYSQKNGGASSARNHGIDIAKGKYIYFIDSDDYIIPTCIESLVSVLAKYPLVNIVQSGVTGWSKHDIYNKRNLVEYSCNKKWIKKTMLNHKLFPFTPWNKLIRLDFIRNHHLRFLEGIKYEDVLWNYHMAKYVYSIAFYFDKTYIYNYDNRSSVMHLEFDSYSWIIILNDLIQNIDPFCRRAQNRLILHYLRRTYRKSTLKYKKI